MYEGRTRGKRIKYTYSDEEDEVYSDATSGARRSTRNTGTHTPADAGPTITASGRQVKSRLGGVYGESLLSGDPGHDDAVGGLSGADGETAEDSEGDSARPRRAAAATNHGQSKSRKQVDGHNSIDDIDDESDGSEQDYGDDEEDDDVVPVETDEEEAEEPSDVEDLMDLDDDKQSLVVKLPVKTPSPERKMAIKLNLSPRKDAPNGLMDNTTINSNHAATTNGKAKTADQALPEVISAVDHKVALPSASTKAYKTVDQAVPNTVSLPAVIPEAQPASQTKPIDILQIRKEAPVSPTLTFRDSPSKEHSFPPSIDVGQDGSP